MTLIHVKRKSDWEVTTVSTQDPRRDEDYVWLSWQPLGSHTGEAKAIPETELSEEESESADLKAKYEEQEGKPVPNNKKNDIEWIKSKLS